MSPTRETREFRAQHLRQGADHLDRRARDLLTQADRFREIARRLEHEIEAERDADEAADNGRNTGGKSYYRPPTE